MGYLSPRGYAKSSKGYAKSPRVYAKSSKGYAKSPRVCKLWPEVMQIMILGVPGLGKLKLEGMQKVYRGHRGYPDEKG